ncbi:TLC domain-containing protein [Mycena epipterygia]|nr:TLC domain-containing protein [Mycena epipterygia]
MDPPRRRGKASKPPHLKPAARDVSSEPTNHFSDSVEPQTPLDAPSPIQTDFPFPAGSKPKVRRVSPWLRSAVEPVESLRLLILPVILFLVWPFLEPHLISVIPPKYTPRSNPFANLFILPHRVPGPGPPLYERGLGDLAFCAYYVVVFSLLRQTITVTVAQRVGRFFGLRRAGKLERFGEQLYAFIYWASFGVWGMRIMSQLPTWWYHTEAFWIDYPHTTMIPELKRYYLLQAAFWTQQFLVLVLGLEKPRKDYVELVIHHIITMALVIVSYITHLTIAGNAVFVSMDIPDALLALPKLLNYIQWSRANHALLVVFAVSWTQDKTTLTRLRWCGFAALWVLQGLNVFWFYMIARVVVNAVRTNKTEDVRSDDEDEDDEEVVVESANGHTAGAKASGEKPNGVKPTGEKPIGVKPKAKAKVNGNGAASKKML